MYFVANQKYGCNNENTACIPFSNACFVVVVFFNTVVQRASDQPLFYRSVSLKLMPFLFYSNFTRML